MTGPSVRPATPDDAPEMVRLAAVMFASIGMDVAPTTSIGMDVSGEVWRRDGEAAVHARLHKDLGAFVVDDPDRPNRLIAAAAGTIATRLPTPANPTGRVGYVQWVCTEEAWRGRGLGRAVMQELLGWYEHHDVHTIELHATPMAEAMYRSLGFSDQGTKALRRRPTPPRPRPGA